MALACCALWVLGMLLASRYMAVTGGPRPSADPFYILVMLLWPGWVFAWILVQGVGMMLGRRRG